MKTSSYTGYFACFMCFITVSEVEHLKDEFFLVGDDFFMLIATSVYHVARNAEIKFKHL